MIGTNPYIAGNPLSGEQGFFGRRDLLDWVVRELTTSPDTRSLILFGQRRIGKTSVLKQLERVIPRESFYPVYFDLQYWANESLDYLLFRLAKKISDSTDISTPDKYAFDSQGHFFCQNFLPQLYNVLGGFCRPVFLFDEFDVLDPVNTGQFSETAAAKAFFPFLYHWMNEDPRPAFVFSGGRHTEDLTISFNPIRKASKSKQIWVLDREDAESLVRQAEVNGTLNFTDPAVGLILDLTHCHPFLTQLLCQTIWGQAYKVLRQDDEASVISPKVIDIGEVGSATKELVESPNYALEFIWEGLSPAEKIYVAACAEISDQNNVISEDQVNNVLSDHGSRLRTREVEIAPRDLIERKVLQEVGLRQYRFTIELFSKWIHRNNPLHKVKDELDKLEPGADEVYRVGEICLDQKKWQEAIKYFRSTLDINPHHFGAQRDLGVALLELGETADAVIELEKAYQADSGDSHWPLVRALLAHAKVQYRQGDIDGALETYERVVQISPDESEAKANRLIILRQHGSAAEKLSDWNAAIDFYTKAGDFAKVAEIREKRAAHYAYSRDWDRVFAILEPLLDSLSDDPDRKKRVTGQLQEYKTEQELDDHYDRGRRALDDKCLDEAENEFTEIFQRKPDYFRDGQSILDWLFRIKRARTPLLQRAPVIHWMGIIILLLIFVFISIWGWRNVGTLDVESAVQGTIVAFTVEAMLKSSIQPSPPATAIILTSVPVKSIELPVEQGTPMPQLATNVISAENITQVVQIANWGKGNGDGIVYSPDGTMLAAATPTGIWLYDAKSSLVVQRIDIQASITSVAFSPNSNFIAIGTHEHDIQLWRVSDSVFLRSFKGHTDAVTCVVFSPDGELLASGSKDNTVQLWNVSSGARVGTLIGHTNYVYNVAFSVSGELLASTSWDNTVRLWHIPDGTFVRTINSARGVAFSPAGNAMATGGQDGKVRLWHPGEGKLLSVLDGYGDLPTYLAFSPNGRTLTAGSSDGSVQMWNIFGTPSYLYRFENSSNAITNVIFSPDGNSLITGAQDDTIRIWNVSGGILERILEDHTGWISSVAFSSDSKFLATGSRDHIVRLWRVSDGTLLWTLKDHQGWVTSVTFSPDNTILATGSTDEIVRLWDVSDGTLLNTLEGHESVVTDITFSPDGATLASASRDQTIRLWNVYNGSSISTIEGSMGFPSSLTYSPDGRILATASEDGHVRLWDAFEGTLLHILQGHQSAVTDVAISPDGNWLATASEDQTVRVWAVGDGVLLHTLRGHQAVVTSIAFSPAGDVLISGAEDKIIRAWDIAQGRQLHVIKEQSPVTGVTFSPDGQLLVSGTRDGIVHLWGFVEN